MTLLDFFPALHKFKQSEGAMVALGRAKSRPLRDQHLLRMRVPLLLLEHHKQAEPGTCWCVMEEG